MSGCKGGAEAAIRARIESWAKALRAKDVDALMAHYAPEVVTFDLAPPLQYAGLAAYRKNFTDWFPSWRGPIGVEIRDLVVTAGEDVAFARSLNHLTGERTGGEATDVWVRVTVCFRRIDGAWMVVHEHVSVPFYMDGSLRAAVDLKP